MIFYWKPGVDVRLLEIASAKFSGASLVFGVE